MGRSGAFLVVLRAGARGLLLGCLAYAVSAGSAEVVTALAPDEGAVKWFECLGGNMPEKGCEATLLWGDWEKGASGWWVRAPKGYLFARHLHAAPERILLMRGRMVGAVDGGKEAMITPGMYWGFDSKAVHWARCEDACLMYITYDSAFDMTFR